MPRCPETHRVSRQPHIRPAEEMIPSSFVGQSVQVEFVNNPSGVMRVWPYYIVTDYSPISVVLTAEYWEDGRRTTGETIVCRRDEIKSIALKDWGKRKHKSWSDYMDSTHFPTYTAECWYGKEVKESWDAAEDQRDEMRYVIDEAPSISKDLVDKIEELYRSILTEPKEEFRGIEKSSDDSAQDDDKGSSYGEKLKRAWQETIEQAKKPGIEGSAARFLVMDYHRHQSAKKQIKKDPTPEQPWSTSQYVEAWEKYMVENYPHLCPERLIAKWREEEKATRYEKPPLGVAPKFLVDEARAKVLAEAIHRYFDRGFIGQGYRETLHKWVCELKTFLEKDQ